MKLRLTEAQLDALRRTAREEGRTMHAVVVAAIEEYTISRPALLHAALERVRKEDAELLDRLSR